MMAPAKPRAVRAPDGRPWCIAVEVAVNLVSPNKSRGEHHMARYRRDESQKESVTWALRRASREPPPGPRFVVILTRQAPRLFDDDNNVASLKSCRDAVAAYLGVDDGDSRIRFAYKQRKAPGPLTMLAIEITSRGAA